MKKKELIEAIQARIDERELEPSFDMEMIEDICFELEQSGVLKDFEIKQRSSADGTDGWLQVEYWSKKLRHSVIVDYDFLDTAETAEEIADALLQTEKEVNEVKEILGE